jgi:hypothetical protein
VLAIGEVEPGNSAIEGVQRQTMIGILAREFPDREHEGTAANELLQMANTRQLA